VLSLCESPLASVASEAVGAARARAPGIEPRTGDTHAERAIGHSHSRNLNLNLVPWGLSRCATDVERDAVVLHESAGPLTNWRHCGSDSIQKTQVRGLPNRHLESPLQIPTCPQYSPPSPPPWRLGQQALRIFHHPSRITFHNVHKSFLLQYCAGGSYVALPGMAPHSDHGSDFCTPPSSKDVDIPVLIVGGGPTGLLLAHMLSQLRGEWR
jgi:hypothetical protein